MSDGAIVIYSPLAEPGNLEHGFAPRLTSLQGKVIGLLGNLKPNTDAVFQRLGERLVAEYGASKVVFREKTSCSMGAPESLILELATSCDAVFTGMGD